jgi:hypothetical protein
MNVIREIDKIPTIRLKRYGNLETGVENKILSKPASCSLRKCCATRNVTGNMAASENMPVR